MPWSETPVRVGGCLCGRVRYRIDGPPRQIALCHCRHCQRQSGSAFSVVAAVPRDAFQVAGEPKVYRDMGDSGHPVERVFCPDCGSPIASRTHGSPDLVYVKAGTLDDTTGLVPTREFYAERRQPWLPDQLTNRSEKPSARSR